jgi:uncharacterized protein (UPF0335 family)
MSRKSNSTPPAAGHNSLDRDRLKSLVERIESVESECASLAEDVRSLYQEAKGQGFDVAALRQIIRMRRQDADKRESREAIIAEYLAALGITAQLR